MVEKINRDVKITLPRRHRVPRYGSEDSLDTRLTEWFASLSQSGAAVLPWRLPAGVFPGYPDRVALVNGHFVAIELKSWDNTEGVTEPQLDWLRQISLAGGFSFIAIAFPAGVPPLRSRLFYVDGQASGVKSVRRVEESDLRAAALEGRVPPCF